MNPRHKRSATMPVIGLASDPLWYKTAIVYEVHVRAFADSSGDGIGDFNGLTGKLDYLQDLGVTALWLLPFYPSPLRDGGYDIADYTGINPSYGTMADFQRFLDEAHRRGLRVITELVLNHTSSEHAWFQRARVAAPGSPERDFYVWSDTADRYTQTRIIFKDFETSNWAWDPVARAYYWHRFYSHQPDLNFDNPAVHQALFDVLDFWFDLGVDGLRLDAVPYLFEREGTTCENLPETHGFLKKLRAHVDAKYADKMLLAEANQWPVDAAAYFGDGDECHMNFHFPLMPRMFMGLHMEDRFPIVDILRQTPPIPESCQWATFLRNHDELTLEMVTDEERDYMYRVYTEDPTARINLGIRRRLAPLLGSRRKIELMKGLLLSLPGTPVIYYGDEIGMGDNVYLGDRDGVRTPMQWSADRNAGFSRVNPQRCYLPVIVDPEYHYEAINVEAQEANPQSLLWWTKRLIALRREHPVLGFGDISFLLPENPRVLAFLRCWKGQHVLVVANMSRHPQFVELDLAAHAGKTPVEMIGRNRFPPITDRPYGLTFGPHMFLWFELEVAAPETRTRPQLTAVDSWTAVTDNRRAFANALEAYAVTRRWFRSKARTRRRSRILDLFDLPIAHGRTLLVLLEIEYTDGEPDAYLIPVGFLQGEPAVHLESRSLHAVIAAVEVTGREAARGVLYDTLATGEGAQALLAIARGGTTLEGALGRLVGAAEAALRDATDEPGPRMLELEQTNSTVPFGDRWVIKVFRQAEPGENPELELGTYLTTRPEARVPPVLGSVAYQRADDEPAAIAVVHQQIASQGTAWDLFSGELDTLFENALAANVPAPVAPARNVLELVAIAAPPTLVERAGHYLRHAALLGRRTGEVHVALAQGPGPAFAPEKYTVMYQQSLFQGARGLMVRTFELLSRRLTKLPAEVQDAARAILMAQAPIEERLRAIQSRPIDALRIRVHGDLHLGQVLFTGDDFVIIDFEGEPARPLAERRRKQSALRDVAGMLRSLDYAAHAVAFGRPEGERAAALAALTAWEAQAREAFLAGYLLSVAESPVPLAPAVAEALRCACAPFELQKAAYELRYELDNRPDWVAIPLAGINRMLGRILGRSVASD